MGIVRLDGVIEQLHEYRKSKDLKKHDQLCMVIDRDRWAERSLAKVAKACDQNNYVLALSNPSFEIWLLLHYQCLMKSTPEYRARLQSLSGDRLKKELRKICPHGYNPSNINIDHYWPLSEKAVRRSRRLDGTDDRWMNSVGTRVYIIIEKILAGID